MARQHTGSFDKDMPPPPRLELMHIPPDYLTVGTGFEHSDNLGGKNSKNSKPPWRTCWHSQPNTFGTATARVGSSATRRPGIDACPRDCCPKTSNRGRELGCPRHNSCPGEGDRRTRAEDATNVVLTDTIYWIVEDTASHQSIVHTVGHRFEATVELDDNATACSWWR